MNTIKEILLIFHPNDDRLSEGNSIGWVANFQRYFGSLISQILQDGYEISSLTIDKLSRDRLDHAAIVLIIQSEELKQSTTGLLVINEWAKAIKAEKKLYINDISRVFKLLIKPFDADSQIPELAEVISTDLFFIDQYGEPREYKRFFGTEAERGYWMKLADIAYEISQIWQLEKQGEKSKILPQERNKTVYLATSGVDILFQRDLIKRELKQHGYEVLPNRSLPKEAAQLERMVKEDIEKCRMSIHLIGEDYGFKPVGSELSIVDIQNKIAHTHTEQMSIYNQAAEIKTPFSRMIWVSPDIKNISERQKIFIEDLKSDAAKLEEAEVLQIPLTDLKSIVREELLTGGRFNTHREVKGYDQEDDKDKKTIYLIQDKEDLKETKTLITFLEKSGYRVLAPSYDGDLLDIRYIHHENLRRCDGSIIYCGSASEDWIKTKLSDLLKAPGFGRQKPLKVKAIFLGSDRTIDAQHFERTKTLVLGNKNGFKPEFLQPFLTKLN